MIKVGSGGKRISIILSRKFAGKESGERERSWEKMLVSEVV